MTIAPQTAAEAGTKSAWWRRITLLVVAAVLSAGAGLVATGIWVFVTNCGILSTTVGGYPEHMGGPTALAIVAGICLWLGSVVFAARHLNKLRYLLIPFPGFLLSYIAILILIAEVAKAIWGPMQCSAGF